MLQDSDKIKLRFIIYCRIPIRFNLDSSFVAGFRYDLIKILRFLQDSDTI
jgi:hypothetical protein